MQPFILFTSLIIGSFVYAQDLSIPLFVQKTGSNDRLPLGNLVRYPADETSTARYTVEQINHDIPDDLYCIGAITEDDRLSCFSYLAIKSPLKYDLYVDYNPSEGPALIESLQLSLKPNPDVEGIVVLERETTKAPKQATKLRKKTKTYEDKKASQNSVMAPIEEDADPVQQSFFRKNWKLVVIGLLIYMVVAGDDKTKNSSKNSGKKKD